MKKIILILAILVFSSPIYSYDGKLILVNHFMQTFIDGNVGVVPEGITLIKSMTYNEPVNTYFYNCDVEIINLHTDLYEIHNLECTAPDTWTGSISLFEDGKLFVNISYTKIVENIYWYSYILDSNDLMNNWRISPAGLSDGEMVNFLGMMTKEN